MIQNDRVLSLVSLARKAGRICAGGFQCEEAVKNRKAKLVIIARDASDNTRKKFENMCAYRKIPCRLYGGMEQLGHSIGCEDRSVLAVTDPGFAQSILKLLQD